MRHLGLRHCLAGCAMIFAASSHATTYEINSTEDADVTVVRQDNADGSSYWQVTSSRTDGFCSLREAVVASNYQIAVDGCAAGTASDTKRNERETNKESWQVIKKKALGLTKRKKGRHSK